MITYVMLSKKIMETESQMANLIAGYRMNIILKSSGSLWKRHRNIEPILYVLYWTNKIYLMP